MLTSNEEFYDEIIQIRDFAQNNGNKISYTMVIDVLKERHKDLESFEEILVILEDEGIEISEGYDEDYVTESEGNPYVPADVNITPRTITIGSICERMEYHEINLNPDFQRRGNLWSPIQQSRLIESLMLKIPLPTFYFDASDENKWVVIDGLQRLSALKNFIVDKTLKLSGLEFLIECNGKGFDDLPRHYYRRIKETMITVYTIEKGTPEEITYNIFRRINTGGLTLEPQEIRHALYNGKATEIIKKLAKAKQFKEATGGSISPNRMLDCEYVTRFVAFTELDYEKLYTGNIDDYLIAAMKYLNKLDNKNLERISKNFTVKMQECHDLFGRWAFRKISDDSRRGPVNKAIFEAMTVCLSKLSRAQINKLLENKDDVLKEYQKLTVSSNFSTWIKAGDKYSVGYRINALEKMLRAQL